MKQVKPLLIAAVIGHFSFSAQAADIYTAYSGSQQGVTIRDANTLAQSSYINTGFNINGIASGNNNNLYLTSGNNIYNYAHNGSLQSSFSWYDTSIVYGDITQKGSNIYAAYSGSQTGVTIRDANTLVQSSVIGTSFTINGLAAGNNNNLYLTSGNTIYNYSIGGSLINSFSWYDNSIIYKDIAVGANSIFTVYSGSQKGVTIRDQNTLAQTGLIIPGFEINGIVAGFNNDVYLTSGNTIYNYSVTGALLNSFSWYDNTIQYGSIAKGIMSANSSPVPVPGAAWLFGSVLLGALRIKRKSV